MTQQRACKRVSYAVQIFTALNGASFNELNSSLLLSPGNGISQSGDVYVRHRGLRTARALRTTTRGPVLFQQRPWLENDTVSVNTFIPAKATAGSISWLHFLTLGDGSTSPPKAGGIGAELVATNPTGYLFEQLTGRVPGTNPVIKPDGNYFILTSVDLAVTDANGNFVGEGATQAQLTFFVPEPSALMLMPVVMSSRFDGCPHSLGPRLPRRSLTGDRPVGDRMAQRRGDCLYYCRVWCCRVWPAGPVESARASLLTNLQQLPVGASDHFQGHLDVLLISGRPPVLKTRIRHSRSCIR